MTFLRYYHFSIYLSILSNYVGFFSDCIILKTPIPEGVAESLSQNPPQVDGEFVGT